MQFHELKPYNRIKKGRRVGRGGKRGTYSGKGGKGQTARAGAKIRPAERDLIMRLPKKRGVKFKPWKEIHVSLPLSAVEKAFNAGEKVTPRTLLNKGVIQKQGGRIPEVKLLDSGKVAKALLVSQCQISGSAKANVESAGGKVTD